MAPSCAAGYASGMPGRSRRNHLLVGLALVVATASTWFPLLENDFVNYDDDLYITNNTHVRQGITPGAVAWAFGSFHGANWFPLTRLSWMLDVQLFGLDPRGFHATSLLLHGANALLLFAALTSLSGALWRSAFVAAVFALHPLHVEPVAWASARKDVVSGLFFMLALLAWAHYARGTGRRRRVPYGAAALALALGLLAKQTLVSLPFVLLLFDEWPLARLRDPASGRLVRMRVQRALLEKIPLLAIACAASVLALAAQRSWGTLQTLERFPLDMRAANALVAGTAYLGKAFWPTGLAVFYPHPGYALSVALVLGAAALLAALTLGALHARRRRPYLVVGWLFFVATLAPVIGLVQVGQAAMADRYMYLPLIGLALPVAWGLGELAERGRVARAAAATLALVALGALGAATSTQLRTWRDSFALFEHALDVTERNHVAHLNLGLALMHADQLDAAALHLGEAVRLAPSSSMAQGILGELRERQGRWSDAARRFRVALRGRREVGRWHAGLGRALYGLGEFEAAVDSYGAALRTRPDAAAVHGNLGLALARLGRSREAIASYREALRLDPSLAEVHGNVGVALAAAGDLDAAVAHYRRALAIDPQLALVHAHLGEAQARRGEVEAALRQLDEAVRLEPRSAEFRAVRARALEAIGREIEAAADYRAALELGARSATLLNNLAWLLATSRDPRVASPEEAVALAEEAARASGRRNPEILDTLSVAYAAAGRRDDAGRAGDEALARAEARGQRELADRIRARLERADAQRSRSQRRRARRRSARRR